MHMFTRHKRVHVWGSKVHALIVGDYYHSSYLIIYMAKTVFSQSAVLHSLYYICIHSLF